MAQVFSARFDFYVKLTLLGLAGAVATLALLWRLVIVAPGYAVGDPVPQPVQFSHKHHVGDDGIDCRYCHTSVETSSFAGLPSTQICMSCHSQLFTDAPALAPVIASWREQRPLRWNRVNDLPDFVYFDHSIHIAKGVGCESCHGRVDRMPLLWRAQSLEMQWCLDCHRQPERQLRPREHVFELGWRPAEDQLALGRRLVQEYHIPTSRMSDCSVCHR